MHPILEVKHLTTSFSVDGRSVAAVRDISFTLHRSEAVGLVGESGCGKSITALSIMRLLPEPVARQTAGSIILDGVDLGSLPDRQMRAVRGGRLAMVFQDPFTSLNPTMRLGDQVAEAIRAHAPMTGREARDRALELLRSVQIPSPETRMRQYPHQISGGQRQRVMIAIAFAGSPEALIADEPTTALDVTVQAQVLSLMTDLRTRTGAASLLITHDMGIVAETCERLLVMYAGRIVEQGPVAAVLRQPRHPYTEGLLASLPSIDGPRVGRLQSIPGQPPPLTAVYRGCAFADRCPRVMDRCRTEEPPTVVTGAGASASCHLLA
ncbi:MAG: ABC transporter ATP-binding protein [Chthonomonadales bacterium]|nr:ABC transporter ATP-binding protein [Chthonomonadales bacterium]